MSSTRTARLPDGSDSRLGWYLWLFAGFFYTGFLIQVAGFLGAFVNLLLDSVTNGGRVVTVAIALLEAGVLTALLIPSVGFARRRLLMPSAAWYGIAGIPAILCVFAVVAAINGPRGSLPEVVGMIAAVVVAWFVDRRRSRMDHGTAESAAERLA
jgi:hypothetical protein